MIGIRGNCQKVKELLFKVIESSSLLKKSMEIAATSDHYSARLKVKCNNESLQEFDDFTTLTMCLRVQRLGRSAFFAMTAFRFRETLLEIKFKQGSR
jgi:hypothetical protein